MSDDPLPLLTLREVARHLREPVDRVKCAVTLYDIVARRRAGLVRLFDRDQLPAIESAVKRVRERKAGRSHDMRRPHKT